MNQILLKNGKKIKPEGTTGPDFVVTPQIKTSLYTFHLLDSYLCVAKPPVVKMVFPACPG
jgi:hypothetical protein